MGELEVCWFGVSLNLKEEEEEQGDEDVRKLQDPLDRGGCFLGSRILLLSPVFLWRW